MTKLFLFFNISGLRCYAKSKGLKGYTIVRKRELIDFLRNYEEYKSEVRKTGLNLQYVPEEFRTLEICKYAVVNELINMRVLYYLLEDGLGYGQGDELTFELFRFVPVNLVTPELCKFTVEKDLLAFRFIPKHLITFELFKYAVEKDGAALKYVPKKFKTKEIRKLAAINIKNLTYYFI